jgi:hypothetical protein
MTVGDFLSAHPGWVTVWLAILGLTAVCMAEALRRRGP